MANLHQWKKYRVDYNYTYKTVRQASDLGEDFEVHSQLYDYSDDHDYRGDRSDEGFHTRYIINNNKVIAKGFKKDKKVNSGDKIYVQDGLYEYETKTIDGWKTKRVKVFGALRGRFVGSVYEMTVNASRKGILKGYEGEIRCDAKISRVVDRKTPKQGAYIGLVQGQEGEFPQSGQQGDFWYVYDKALNEAPYISGSNLDLGSKDEDFYIEYVVSDSDGDVVTVDILVDDIAKIRDKRTPLGVNQKYLVRLDEFSLGDHKIEIRARDSKGAEAPSRTYYFSKANTAPKISGTDTDLGNKSTGFTINYRVEDKDKDPVSVRISLDDKEMASISDAQGKDLRFTLDDSKVRELEIGKTYTITIKADDGKGGVAYRRYSFTKVNTPPIISGVDSDLGKVKEPVTIKFSVSDVEKDKIYFSLLLDGREVMSQEGEEDGKEYSYKIDHDTFIRLAYGKHELKLIAWDDENIDNKTIRKFTFERISGGLDVEVKLAEYDTQPKKIVAVPHGDFIDTKTFQVLACNNYLDAKPTWEDITNMSKIARAFSFTNTTKTAGKWALGVRVIIENGQADISSVLRGIKGGIE